MRVTKLNQLLVVCGPTATGKSKLAVSLARKFDGEIISADSRQVYQGMDIGTGKDLPENSKFEIRNLRLGGYYSIVNVKVWGYDLVSPKEEFSVAAYEKFAEGVIKDILARGKLPIVVGGSGLYLRAVIDGIGTSAVGVNHKLRKKLELKSVSELYQLLKNKSREYAEKMTTSDKKNPRRLMRALEIIESGQGIKKREKNFDVLAIGLTLPKVELDQRIEKRVNTRVKMGIEEEIGHLLASKVSWKDKAMSALGYRQWRDYFENKKGRNEVIKDWKQAEKQYAKRQMTWFKKEPRVFWFDVSRRNWQKKVEDLVKKWYSISNLKPDAKKN